MKYNLIDAINICLFIVLIILIINKINKIENFTSILCNESCEGNYDCSEEMWCDNKKKSCCKKII